MTDPSRAHPDPAQRRSEKLRAIAAVFGSDVAARIGGGGAAHGAALAADRPDPDRPDPDRLAWQTNRLIRHLRDRVGEVDPTGAHAANSGATGAASSDQAPPAAATRPTARVAAQPGAPPVFRRTARMPTLAAGEDLAQEHPAVIAHVLRGEGQEIRVAVLRALPGTLARDVMRRLKAR